MKIEWGSCGPFLTAAGDSASESRWPSGRFAPPFAAGHSTLPLRGEGTSARSSFLLSYGTEVQSIAAATGI